MPSKAKPTEKRPPAKAGAPKSRATKPAARAAKPRRNASAAPSWTWAALTGIIGEQCFRTGDAHPEEVARWWYDFMAPVHKYRWRVGSIEKASASAEEARTAILSALASRDGQR
jgi:hypothetical protein